MEAGWFYDTNFHLNQAGRTFFTRQLIHDLKAEFSDTSLIEIDVPAEALSAYRTDYRFSQYADRIQAR